MFNKCNENIIIAPLLDQFTQIIYIVSRKLEEIRFSLWFL